ncbi:MAG: tubulin-like doman-containing protein, partial [bacterium]
EATEGDDFPPILSCTMEGFTQDTVAGHMSNVREWWYPNYRCKPCTIGYNQIRVNGRFGLYLSSRGEGSVVKQIDEAIDTCTAVGKRETRSSGKKNSADLTVCLCGSICGGTGGGVLLDLGYLVRELCLRKSKIARVYGILVLPEIMEMKSDAGDVTFQQANAYAFLKELNWYCSTPSKDKSSSRSVFYQGLFGKVKVDESADNVTVKSPFDQSFMLSNRSLDGSTIDDFDSVRRLMGSSLALLMAGTSQQELLENAGVTEEFGEANELRSVRFGGFGSYTLKFPARNVSRYLGQQASASLIGKWITKAPNDESTGGERCQSLVTHALWPLDLKAMKEKLVENGGNISRAGEGTDGDDKDQDLPSGKLGLPKRKTAYADDLAKVNGSSYPVNVFAKSTLGKIRVEYGSKGEYSLVLSEAARRYGQQVVHLIRKELAQLLGPKGPKNGLCAAAVFLAKVKRHCEGLVGAQDTERRPDQGPTLRAQALALSTQLQQDLNIDGNAEIKALKDGFPAVNLLGTVGRWREKVNKHIEKVELRYKDQCMLEALNLVYTHVHDVASGLKIPIRFLQEHVAEGVKREFEEAASSVLSDDDVDLTQNGVEDIVCGNAADVDVYVRPKISILNGSDPKAQQSAEEAIVGQVLPEIKKMIEEMWHDLAQIGDPLQHLLNRKENYERSLKEILCRRVEASIMEDLRANMTIADAIMCKSTKDKYKSATDELESLASTSNRLFCGMSQLTITKSNRDFRRQTILCVNGKVFEDAVEKATRRRPSLGKMVPKGQKWDTNIDDPFRISVLNTLQSVPLFALSQIDTYATAYASLHTESKASEHPLHTDRRFEPWETQSNDYQLPPVEVLQGHMDDAIFLFVLAEQDWWKGLKGFTNNANDTWAGDLGPLVVKSDGQRHYYTWEGPTFKDSALGRSSAQLAFYQDRKRILGEMRELLAKRWNSAYSPAEKREKLTQVMNTKNEAAKDRDTAGYNDLRLSFANEARIIKERLDRKALDL